MNVESSGVGLEIWGLSLIVRMGFTGTVLAGYLLHPPRGFDKEG